MPRYVPLSDGQHFSTVPDGTSDADAQSMVSADQAKLDRYYQDQAASGQPVTAGASIYNGYETLPNTVVGRGVSWAEQNVPGYDWLNRHLPQPDPASMRVAVSVPTGIPDFVASTINVAKHQIAPGLGTDYDVPYAGQAGRDQLGVPALPADASKTEQIAEAVIPGLVSGSIAGAPLLSLGHLAASAARGVGGVYGSDWGGRIGGELGSYLGGLFGSGGVPVKQIAAKTFGPSLASATAPETYQAATSIRPSTPEGNFQGLPGPRVPLATGETPDFSTFVPSFRALANPAGQRVAATLSGLPYAGAPIERANENTRAFVQSARDAAATDIAGPRRLPPSGASPATIGPVLTQGAQSAIIRIAQEQQNRQRAMDALMQGREVPVPNTISIGMNLVANNARSPDVTSATLSRVGDLQNDAPGGANYNRAPVPLPAVPTVPWSNVKDWVGGLNTTLNSSGRAALPPDIANVLKIVANQERERAADAVSPGAGAQFRQNNEAYARSLEDRAALETYAGEPLGQSGRFVNVPGEARAAGQMTGNMQSPSNLSPLVHPAFPQDARLNAAGQFVSSLGGAPAGSAGGAFRPERFASDLNAARPGLNVLTQGANPAAGDVLSNAATIGGSTVAPTTGTVGGLLGHIGTGLGVAKGLDVASRVFENVIPWKPAQYVGIPQLARAMASGLESDAMKRAMAGQYQDWRVPARNATITGTIGDQD